MSSSEEEASLRCQDKSWTREEGRKTISNRSRCGGILLRSVLFILVVGARPFPRGIWGRVCGIHCKIEVIVSKDEIPNSSGLVGKIHRIGAISVRAEISELNKQNDFFRKFVTLVFRFESYMHRMFLHLMIRCVTL